MNRSEIVNGSSGPEIGALVRGDEIQDPNPADEDDGGADRPSRPVPTGNVPIRLPGYRELDTRVQLREEG